MLAALLPNTLLVHGLSLTTQEPVDKNLGGIGVRRLVQYTQAPSETKDNNAAPTSKVIGLDIPAFILDLLIRQYFLCLVRGDHH